MECKKKSFIIIASIMVLVLFTIALSKPKNIVSNTVQPQMQQETKAVQKISLTPKPKELTKASESPLNQNMKELAMQGALTSDGLTKADMAYWAVGTYGYNCHEIKQVKFVTGSKTYLGDDDIDIESRIINPKKFAYQEALCTSGLKLRFYKRKDYYPYIITQKELQEGSEIR